MASSTRNNSKNAVLDALLGQANLALAYNNSEEALSLLEEVVRQNPNNPDVYSQISSVYADRNEMEKSFQYRLLAAHLNKQKTTAAEWADVGNVALGLERMDDAADCFERAVRADPHNWVYYEKRIDVLDTLGMDEQVMKTRLAAAKSIDCRLSKVTFEWLRDLIRQENNISIYYKGFGVYYIRQVAEFYIAANDEERATEALEIFILRSYEFGLPADSQHLILLGMLMAKERYGECVKSILALQRGVTALAANGLPAIEITHSTTGYKLAPFPPTEIHAWHVEESFSTAFLARLIVAFIRMGRKEFVPKLIDTLLERDVKSAEEEMCFLEVGRAYHSMGDVSLAVKYVELLIEMSTFRQNADAWFQYGVLMQTTGSVERAQDAYERVIAIQPDYVDARINLSSILQNQGRADEALNTLKDYDLDMCSHLPDERLLKRQAEVLLEQRHMSQYAKCVRMILVPHFYLVHHIMNNIPRKANIVKRTHISLVLKRAAFDTLQNTPLERTVKRLGALAAAEKRSTEELSGNELHDYALKLAELAHDGGNFAEMLHVVAYAFLQPKIAITGLETFRNLLFYASIKAGQFSLAFEYVRSFYMVGVNEEFTGKEVTTADSAKRQLFIRRLCNAFAYVFLHVQNPNHQRFILRALGKSPDNTALRTISGNNSLLAGAYRHALGEYFRAWLENKDNPLLCMLIGLTFVHMACKKDISGRHMLAMKGVAFMKRYQRLRGDCQETFYNIGRMLHQMGMLAKAVYFYERVLYDAETPLVRREDEQSGEIIMEQAARYDLRRSAAYNLALIYDTSGNRALAREILEEFCTV